MYRSLGEPCVEFQSSALMLRARVLVEYWLLQSSLSNKTHGDDHVGNKATLKSGGSSTQLPYIGMPIPCSQSKNDKGSSELIHDTRGTYVFLCPSGAPWPDLSATTTSFFNGPFRLSWSFSTLSAVEDFGSLSDDRSAVFSFPLKCLYCASSWDHLR